MVLLGYTHSIYISMGGYLANYAGSEGIINISSGGIMCNNNINGSNTINVLSNRNIIKYYNY